MERDSLIDLDVVKPAAGGRMIARVDGQVVLVAGTIPGERVRARIERVGKGVAYAETIEVIDRSPDRREVACDPRCGGNVLAHIIYARQLQVKSDIIADAFARIARMPSVMPQRIMASPERGYRMRARLHVRRGRVGFFREGTHDLCDAAATGQLLPATGEWLESIESAMARERLDGIAALEVAENVPADQRACYFELVGGERRSRYATLESSYAREVTDIVHARPGDPASALRLRRSARAFFQGNRYLLEPLAQLVVSLIPPGPVVDLYAGVGLFGLSLVASGFEAVSLVEGDAVSGGDLLGNAEPYGSRATVHRQSVESYLSSASAASRLRDGSVVVDPPRTGMSALAVRKLLERAPRQIVYVSCDVATLARDSKVLADSGYALNTLVGVDLFPNTAHVECVATFSKAADRG